MAHVLQEYVDEEINIDRVIRMLLVHDIVEIDAGDTFAFAPTQALNDQSEKELRAAQRIFGLLPIHQRDELLSLWLEFEQGESASAKYAKAIDRVVPLLMNLANDGGGWRRHSLKRSQLIRRNEFLRISMPRLWDYVVCQLDFATEQGWISPD